MGYRYQNKLDEENERKYLESLSPLKRIIYKLCYRVWMLIAILFALYSTIGWWLVKLF